MTLYVLLLILFDFSYFHWSSCSAGEYHFKSNNWKCMNNYPHFSMTNATFIGEIIEYTYSLDDQCRMEFGQGFKFCRSFQVNFANFANVLISIVQLYICSRFCKTSIIYIVYSYLSWVIHVLICGAVMSIAPTFVKLKKVHRWMVLNVAIVDGVSMVTVSQCQNDAHLKMAFVTILDQEVRTTLRFFIC